MQYSIRDDTTQKTITFDWHEESEPTEADVDMIFEEARGLSPEGNPVPPDMAAYGQDIEAGVQPNREKGVMTPQGFQTGREVMDEAAASSPEAMDERKLAAYKEIRPHLDTVGSAGGLGVGGVVGSTAGPVGTVAGGGMGYATWKEMLRMLDEKMGYETEAPRTMTGVEKAIPGQDLEKGALPERMRSAGVNVLAGAEAELAGRGVAKAVGPAAKWTGEKLKGAGRRVYRSAIKAPTTLTPAEGRAMAETGLREGITPNEKGLGKLAELERELIGKIEDVVNWASAKKGKVATQEVIKRLRSEYKKMGGADPEGARKLIDTAVDKFRKHGRYLTVKQIHRIKKEIYKDLPPSAFAPTKRDVIKTKIDKTLARGAKEVVEEAAPEVKGLNKRAGELIELSEVLGRTVNRIENSNLLSLNTDLAAVAGAHIAGGPGAVIGAASRGIFGLPIMKARLAQVLYGSGKQAVKIAEALKDTPAGKVFMKEYMEADIQAVLKGAGTPKEKVRKLTVNALKKDGFKALPAGKVTRIDGPNNSFVMLKTPPVRRRDVAPTRYYKKIKGAVLIYDPTKESYRSLPKSIEQMNKRTVNILDLAQKAITPKHKTPRLTELAQKTVVPK